MSMVRGFCSFLFTFRCNPVRVSRCWYENLSRRVPSVHVIDTTSAYCVFSFSIQFLRLILKWIVFSDEALMHQLAEYQHRWLRTFNCFGTNRVYTIQFSSSVTHEMKYVVYFSNDFYFSCATLDLTFLCNRYAFAKERKKERRNVNC